MRRALLVLGLGLLPWAALQAQADHRGAAVRSACQADAKALCPEQRPGGGQLVACLVAHKDRLSASCQAALPALQACREAVRQRCPESGASGPQRACLAKLRQDLPEACATVGGRV